MANTPLGMARAATKSDMGVSTGLTQKFWHDSMLYMESLYSDPIINNPALIETIEVGAGVNEVPLPKTFFMEITPKDKKGKAAREVYLTFLSALSDAPIQGNASDLVGNEQNLELKYSVHKANDWATAVAEDTYGIDFREIDVYGAYAKIRPLLSQYLGELRGLYARQAFCTEYSDNLTAAPISASAGLSKHIYYPGLGVTVQPEYDKDLTDWTNLVGQAGATAGALAAGANRLTVPRLLTMIDYAMGQYIKPVTIGGKGYYLMFCHPDEIRYLRDPSISNSFGNYWKDEAALTDIKKLIPEAEMTLGGELIIVRDRRAPTLVSSGTGSSYTLTFGYLKYGRTTTRTTGTGAQYFNVNVMCGAGALAKYEPELPHFETQKDNYGKDKGNGFIGGVGYQTPSFDVDSASQSNTSAQQEGSMLVLSQRE